jgi:hypothetical protein
MRTGLPFPLQLAVGCDLERCSLLVPLGWFRLAAQLSPPLARLPYKCTLPARPRSPTALAFLAHCLGCLGRAAVKLFLFVAWTLSCWLRDKPGLGVEAQPGDRRPLMEFADNGQVEPERAGPGLGRFAKKGTRAQLFYCNNLLLQQPTVSETSQLTQITSNDSFNPFEPFKVTRRSEAAIGPTHVTF